MHEWESLSLVVREDATPLRQQFRSEATDGGTHGAVLALNGAGFRQQPNEHGLRSRRRIIRRPQTQYTSRGQE